MKNKFFLLLALLLISEISYSEEKQLPAQNQIEKQEVAPQKQKRRPSIKAMSLGASKATASIKIDPFSQDSIWDLNIVSRDSELENTLKKFLADDYAQKAKNLDLAGLTKNEIATKLTNEGFKKREPEGRVDGLLGRGKDREFQDAGDIYTYSDGSMVRIKDPSINRHQRPQAYVIKAVLKNPSGPVTWQNEAFKVTNNGYPVPKGPKQNQA